jgi:peptide/nickel transport system permease protein
LGRRRWIAAIRTPLGATALTGLALLALLALIGPLIWGEAAEQVDLSAINQGPSASHLFGTDNLGRDVLSRVLVATRLSLGLALLATAIGVTLGLFLGTLPTVLGRRAGRFVVAVVNFAVAFPGLLLALFFAVVFGVGARGAVLAIGIAGAPSFARLVQTMSASVAGRDYVAAARLAGVGRLRTIRRHVLPNIAEPLAVNATMAAGGALLAFAGLSFLGLGVQPPAYDWGRLLGEGLDRIYVNPAAALAPGIAIVLAGLMLALFGEACAAVFGLRTGLTIGMSRVATGPLDTTPALLDELPVESAERPATQADDGAAAVLATENLTVRFPSAKGMARAVDNVSLVVRAGQAVGVVGESGSGKSVTALAVAGLLPDSADVAADRLDVDGESVLGASESELRERLGTTLAMVFQDPTTSFNPSMRVGRQLGEVAEYHEGQTRRDALATAIGHMQAVRIPAAERRSRQYPHEFSGGMRQRAVIAMGLMGQPKVIVADEPTTALDVTVQRQVLRLLDRIRRDTSAALLLISHDIAVIAQMCERVVVMYAGRIVEELPADRLNTHAAHPYTRALLAAVPDMSTERDGELTTIPGRPPEPAVDRIAGCAFAPRCALADERCRSEQPSLEPAGPDQRVACWNPVDAAAGKTTGNGSVPHSTRGQR